jgi:hypothetical protein
MKDMFTDEQIVRVPSFEAAAARRMEATAFEDVYVPSEGPRMQCLPRFRPSADGIHVDMVAGGVRGQLLPICARSCAKALELFLLGTKRVNHIEAFAPAVLLDAPSEAVTEDLVEVGGFGFFADGKDEAGSSLMYLHLHSITTSRGVVFGPLSLGDEQEIHDRLRAAFDELPDSAVERSIIKLNITAPPRRIEHVPDEPVAG